MGTTYGIIQHGNASLFLIKISNFRAQIVFLGKDFYNVDVQRIEPFFLQGTDGFISSIYIFSSSVTVTLVSKDYVKDFD